MCVELGKYPCHQYPRTENSPGYPLPRKISFQRYAMHCTVNAVGAVQLQRCSFSGFRGHKYGSLREYQYFSYYWTFASNTIFCQFSRTKKRSTTARHCFHQRFFWDMSSVIRYTHSWNFHLSAPCLIDMVYVFWFLIYWVHIMCTKLFTVSEWHAAQTLSFVGIKDAQFLRNRLHKGEPFCMNIFVWILS